jgi:GNAT superfamily N-acetyltransferase
MTKPAIRLRTLSGREAVERIAALADVLVDCVEGGASVSFMAPFARDKAEAFWLEIANDAAHGGRVLIVAEDIESGAIVGAAQLVFGHPENQPHRADVAKVLVHRRARERGVGAALMGAVEEAARAAGKTLLVLDTTHGSAAERLYERLRWTRLGVMPGHALMPDGRMSDTTYFYKHLV